MKTQHTTEERERRIMERRIKFDGTVTFGNLLTLIAMMGTILMMWRNMESRIMIVEERMAVQSKNLEKIVGQVERYIYAREMRENANQ